MALVIAFLGGALLGLQMGIAFASVTVGLAVGTGVWLVLTAVAFYGFSRPPRR